MLFRLNNVWKSYGGTEILKGVSFQVNISEKVGLVGRNGAGKTTVFRLITEQEAADDGEVIKMNGLKLGLLDQHVDFGEAETVHTAALSAFKEIHDIEAEMRSLEKKMPNRLHATSWIMNTGNAWRVSEPRILRITKNVVSATVPMSRPATVL